MKRLLCMVTTLLLVAISAEAVSMRPVRPLKGIIGLSYEGSREKRDMEWMTDKRERTESVRNLHLANISYGLTEDIELDFRIGASNLDYVEKPGLFTPTETVFNHSHTHAWGLGYRALLHKGKWFQLAGIANFLRAFDHKRKNQNFYIDDDVDYREWNIGTHLQLATDRLYPYLGIKYSDATMNYDYRDGSRTGGRDIAKENWGGYGGFGFRLTKNVSGFAEARFLDEKSFGGGLKFDFRIPKRGKKPAQSRPVETSSPATGAEEASTPRPSTSPTGYR